ncbi:hypothetical protein PybrP1_006134 [[Pythium] brassicae (nom. inval.)]|nr:hypothetical protein PybrP1_006134 [[Pythium] brassicae (nom. inval.)]
MRAEDAALPPLTLKCLAPLEGTLSKVRASMLIVLKKSLAAKDAGGSGADATVKGGSRRTATLFQRAYALQRLRQFEGAVRDYDVCAEQEPTRALVFYNRGCALYALGRRDEAVQDLTKAIKLEAKNLLFVESRATVLKELGRFHEAIHDYAWLEALRRVTNKPTRGLAPVAGGLGGGEFGASSHHGSFSSQLGDFSGSFQSRTPPVGSVQMNATDGERESRARRWFLRFLKQKPVARTPSDLQEAVAYTKSWSFFRGMTKEMVEQCLEEASYGNFEAEQVVVEQSVRPAAFHVVLNTIASLVKNVDVHGVSKVRELKTLCQGDSIGADPFTLSFADGMLRTLRQHAAVPLDAKAKNATRYHGPDSADSLSRSPTGGVDSRTSSHGSERTDPGGGGCEHLGDDDEMLLPLEPASYSCLDEVHCLVLSTDVYRSILHEREEAELEERMEFLRSCRVFQSCTEDVLTALAVLSSRKVYDPGKNILRAGDVVTQLCLIKRGVCQVRKTITVSRQLVSPSSKRPTQFGAVDDPLTSRSTDGSWVLDNGWMLTNPRLVYNAQHGGKNERVVTKDVDVAILASGQVFGELSVLQPGQPSQVTIRTQTLVEILVLQEHDLARLDVQFQSGAMNALQDSLLFHNPPQQKIVQLHREFDAWEKKKRGVLDDVFGRTSPLVMTSKSGSRMRGSSSTPGLPPPRSSPQRQTPREKAQNFKLTPLKKTQVHE